MVKTYTVSTVADRTTIKLTGKWLNENGFNVGDKIQVFNDNGILVLVRLSEEETKNINMQKEILSLKNKLKTIKEN